MLDIYMRLDQATRQNSQHVGVVLVRVAGQEAPVATPEPVAGEKEGADAVSPCCFYQISLLRQHLFQTKKITLVCCKIRRVCKSGCTRISA